ncbi:MAG TPA: cation diffusion facilitator family transporter [Thermomicrobiales bacterium]|nr:cation diffusion facilitator family transporter [Thermomicrobiales bacterium]
MNKTIYRFALISIGAATITIILKLAAWWVTDSVGFLSDALESVVNLVGAIVALVALIFASREPDEEHEYGHAKVEYFSSGAEGALIMVAAAAIVLTSVPRLFNPQAVSSTWTGIGISVVATLINLGAARLLSRAGKNYGSIALEADADHLFTDVITTGGVILGIVLISLTGWDVLDPVIALIVAGNIVRVGYQLLVRSAHGLMDTALPANEIQLIEGVLDRYRTSDHIEAHALRTRQAGQRRFGSVHILVPGDWTVDRGHHLVEQIERDIGSKVPGILIVTHLESLDDPLSFDDDALPETQPIVHGH